MGRYPVMRGRYATIIVVAGIALLLLLTIKIKLNRLFR